MLNCVERGRQQEPAVLFLHGFMGSSADWTGVTAALADACHSLAVDLPGHGASTGLADAFYTMEGAAKALLDLLDGRGIERCAVVGYSMGGRLALYFAMRFPERCRALFLESASPGLATAQERTARPSTCTVQEPHAPMPQPYLAPVSWRWSLSTQSRGVVESPSKEAGSEFSSKETMPVPHVVWQGDPSASIPAPTPGRVSARSGGAAPRAAGSG